jgi:hypothetical protein
MEGHSNWYGAKNVMGWSLEGNEYTVIKCNGKHKLFYYNLTTITQINSFRVLMHNTIFERAFLANACRFFVVVSQKNIMVTFNKASIIRIAFFTGQGTGTVKNWQDGCHCTIKFLTSKCTHQEYGSAKCSCFATDLKPNYVLKKLKIGKYQESRLLKIGYRRFDCCCSPSFFRPSLQFH